MMATAEPPKKYKIVLMLKSGKEVESITFDGFPPEAAIKAGMELYEPVSFRIVRAEEAI
jgi:hypothetical protein